MKPTLLKKKILALALFSSTLSPLLSAQVLEEIIVTAQFIEQSVQDTPIAITALSGDLLEARGQFSTSAIGAQAPSVQLQQGPSSQGNSLNAFIRGIGQADNSPTLEPGVGIYVDDVYFNNVQGSLLDLMDIDRIEILRGPQGTLAGKNSIGGAIKIYSERPYEKANGHLDIMTGDYGAFRVRGASNVTLIEDQLFARVSALHNERDGYVTNYDFGCVYPNSGVPTTRSGNCKDGTLGGIESTAARLSLRWLASDNLEVNLSTDYVDDESEPSANILTATSPTLAPIFAGPPAGPDQLPPLAWPWVNPGSPDFPPPSVVPVFPAVLDPCVFITGRDGCSPDVRAAFGAPAITDSYASFTGFNDPRTGFVVPRKSTLETSTTNLNIDWEIAEDMQFQSITALRTYDVFYGTDDDATPVPLSTQTNTQEHSAISQEFRINKEVSDNLNYTVGAYYQETETTIGGRIGLGASGLDFLVDDIVETESFALFANSIWAISDNFELAAGLRYSDDEKTFDFIRSNLDGSFPASCEIINTPGGPIVDPGSSPNCLVGGVNGIPAQKFADDRIDYRLALSYIVNDDMTFYASTSTGYKAGGANSRPFFAEQVLPHTSEELTSYEVGAKMEFLDNSLRVNTAIFTNDYSDVIVTLFDCTAVTGAPFGSPCFLPANAGEAEVNGFELEFDWSITDNIMIDGSYSIVDFDYTRAAASITTSTQQPYTPETTWSIGAQYTLDTGYGSLSPRIDVVYQDEMYSQPGNSPQNFIEDYTLVNASLRWLSPDEKWAVSLQGKNLTDEYYLFNATDQLPSGYASSNPAPPRTWTASLRYNF